MILTFASHLLQSDITIKIDLVESQPRLVDGFNRKVQQEKKGVYFCCLGFVVDAVLPVL